MRKLDAPNREPVRDTTSSPEEQKQAHNFLRVARSSIDDAFNARDGDEQMQHLNAASRALNRVRNLDPAATIISEEKDGSHSVETHDVIAAQLLYLQSKLEYDRGKNVHRAESDFLNKYQAGQSDDIIRNLDTFDKRAFECYARALEPARKAVLYNPHRPIYHRHLSLVFAANHLSTESREALQKAFELDPNDVETLKLMV